MASGTNLGRECQRDHGLKDGVGRYGPCVNGKATSSSLVKKDGEYP